MARYIPKPKGRPKEEKTGNIIYGPKPSLEDTYYRYLNPKGEKWILCTNNDNWVSRIKAEEVYRISKTRCGSVSEEFAAFFSLIKDVRMFSNYRAAILVDLKTEAQVDYFVGKSKQFGLYIQKVWYGELPTEHFPYDEVKES